MRFMRGDSMKMLKRLDKNSVDAIVTDPPAGIFFMGKKWDSDKGGREEWIAWMTKVMKRAKRVLKPGGHALVWALPRTSHWTGTALERAGFEIRDVIIHLFGSGFPKSHNIGKALDKKVGAKRKVSRLRTDGRGKWDLKMQRKSGDTGIGHADGSKQKYFETFPATENAKQWDGWGTALKPASEHWILCRKPLSEKTVAANVLKWGTGAINIDGGRIGTERRLNNQKDTSAWHGNNWSAKPQKQSGEYKSVDGRWPADVTLDRESARMLDEQKEGASRFFYIAKANKKERNGGVENLVPVRSKYRSNDVGNKKSIKDRLHGSVLKQNHHPTVKSVGLMKYLCKLITPPQGTILDPFMGSGSTGIACVEERFRFIGIEKDKQYMKIAKKRIKWWKNKK